MKVCPRCGKEITEPRKKFCNENCKYWFNQIKRDRERYLPPAKKRNKNYFYMVVGSERAKPNIRQGKRCNGMITGAMAAAIYCTVEKVVEVTPDNVKAHFEGITNYKPTYLRLGDQSIIRKDEILHKLGIEL